MDSSLIIHLSIFVPFVLITIWYFVDNSQRYIVLGDVASRVKRYELQEREILEERKAKQEFSKVHDKYKIAFILSCVGAAFSLFVPAEAITVPIKIIFSILYGILCIIYAKRGYAANGTKIAWIFLGLLSFTISFIVTLGQKPDPYGRTVGIFFIEK